MRPKLGVLLLVLSSVLSACFAPGPNPPTTLVPPTIQIAGIATSVTQDNDAAHYELSDGRTFTARFINTRLLTDSWGGQLIVAGQDADGPFLAAYMTQGGLPDDCYVDNSRGIDRGFFVELRGVLWRKAGGFVQAQVVSPDFSYPGATRFCFNANAEITRTISP